MKISVRRCVVCGVREKREKLFRFVLSEGALIWDRPGKAQSRGAYMHPRVTCWSRMNELFRWERAFRKVPTALDKESINILKREVYHHLLDLTSDPKEERGGSKPRGRAPSKVRL